MPFLTMPDHPGVFVDGLLRDPDGSLLFASAWGRDMPLLELLAHTQLAETETETEHDPVLEFSGPAGEPMMATIDRPERFRRHQGRMPQTCVFGSLTHTWIYDRLLIEPDIARQRAILLRREFEDPPAREQRLWELVLRTCSVPLLRAWKDPVLAAFREHGFVTRTPGFGVEAVAVHLTSPEAVIGELVRSGSLTVEDAGTC